MKRKKGKKKSNHPVCQKAIEMNDVYDEVSFSDGLFFSTGLFILPDGKVLSTGGLHMDIDYSKAN